MDIYFTCYQLTSRAEFLLESCLLASRVNFHLRLDSGYWWMDVMIFLVVLDEYKIILGVADERIDTSRFPLLHDGVACAVLGGCVS